MPRLTATSAGWDTLKAFGEKQGLQPGMTALLHTWGSNLSFHPHLHCIVPGGGYGLRDGHWKNLPQVKDSRDSEPFLFPVKALSPMFRAKWMAAFTSEVAVPEAVRAQCFKRPWVVYAKSPVCGVEFVRRYSQHILPERFVRIRHFGFLASGNRGRLAELQAELDAESVQRHRKRKFWQTICAARGLVMNQCRECGIGILFVKETIPRVRSPDFCLAL